MSRPRVFDDKKMARMREMAAAGFSPPEIARALGSTPSSVVCTGNKYGISFGGSPRISTPIRASTMAALSEEARQRKCTVNRLARRILTAAIMRGPAFIDALLIPPPPPPPRRPKIRLPDFDEARDEV